MGSMMMRSYLFFLDIRVDMGAYHVFIFFAFCLGCAVDCCPPAEDIAPYCTCRDIFSDNMMVCTGLLSPEQLIGPVRSVALSNAKVFALSINNSSLLYIPHGIFKDVHLEKIRFVSTQIMALSDSDFAFEGLENTLTEIRATDAHYIAQWDWQQLKNLKRLDLIDVNWISLGSIDEPFPDLPTVSALGIIRAEISFIVDFAFSKLSNLKILNMKENDITELKRNMLPEPADNLMIIDFSSNELSTLPEDFFTNMPNIEQVHLGKNKFVTLNEKSFATALRVLSELTMQDNPLRCDCRMRWLAGIRVPTYFAATCSSPESLKGVQIRSLDLKSLWC